ncbi:MAG: ABC transporter permease [Lachnospiraceae bacterium]|nr:ABC transporter permease [Candidatus Equihabitans merdae]
MKSRANILLYNIGAVIIGLIISAILLLFMKVNPLDVCGQALGKIVSDKYNLGEVLVKATPLIFTSLAFAFTYNANLFNIGAQGQFLMGSIVAVALSLKLQSIVPTFILLIIVLIGSAAGGAFMGGLIGGAKAKFKANEFLVSMMSTYVVSNFMDYLLRTSLQETKAEYMQTDAIDKAAYLPTILPGTRVHLGFVIAVLFAIGVWVLLNKTTLGFQIRAVGKNSDAANLGGIKPTTIYVISFMIAGGLAGIAGLTEINGVQHMLLRDFNASIGSYGIGIAILANGNPIGCIFASILFGFLNVMGTTMGRLPGLNIPASIIELIEGIVMACVIISYAVRRIVENKKKKKQMRKAGA